MIEQHNQVGTNENDNEVENNDIGVEEEFLNSI